MFTCVHCGQPHPDDAKFCAATGQAIQGPTATERVRPLGEQKGVFDLLKEAAQLYRNHARAFLITAAVVFAPAVFVNAAVLSALAVPATGAPQAIGFAFNALAVTMNGLIIYGLALPLVLGAMTAATADRLLGGGGDWRQYWGSLLRHRAPLVTALVPPALLTAAGYGLFKLPGIVLSYLFAFLVPAVLLERLGGTAAIRRSYQLVLADPLRSALLFIIFALGRVVASRMGQVFGGSYFMSIFLGDLLFLLLMPVLMIAAVLLYFDLRRKLEGLDDEHLKRELESLRPVA